MDAGLQAPDLVPGVARRWATPTGEPCPRVVRVDGTLEGTGDCVGCGFCLLILEAAWGDP